MLLLLLYLPTYKYLTLTLPTLAIPPMPGNHSAFPDPGIFMVYIILRYYGSFKVGLDFTQVPNIVLVVLQTYYVCCSYYIISNYLILTCRGRPYRYDISL